MKTEFASTERAPHVTDLAVQHEHGQYYEEVSKQVDGVLEDVTTGALRTRADVLTSLARSCAVSAYAMTPARAAETLLHSRHPTAALSHYGPDALIGIKHWDKGRAPFPWAVFAQEALFADCNALLLSRQTFLNLKEKPDGHADSRPRETDSRVFADRFDA